MNNNLYKQVIGTIMDNSEYIQKLKYEKFKDRWLIDLVLNNSLLNITVGEVISVNINNKLNQYLLDFYSNEKVFKSFEEFDAFFSSILEGYKRSTKGLYAKYNGDVYLCDIEAMSVDPDRQMGVEILYEVNFFDKDGEAIIAAEVSEYPSGIFTVYHKNKDVVIETSEIVDYLKQINTDGDIG